MVFFKEWSPAVELQAEKNMELSERIRVCHHELQEVQARLKQLKDERRKQTEKFRLMTSAQLIWPRLRKNRKWSQDVIVAALQSPHLPRELTEQELSRFSPQQLNPVFRERDVILARAARADFHRYWASPDAPTFQLRHEWTRDKEVMTALFRALPYLLVAKDIPFHFLADKDIFRAILTGPAMVLIKSMVLKHFSKGILSSRQLMLECVPILGCNMTSVLWESPLHNDKAFALEMADQCDNDLPDKILRRFSQRVRDDEEVVLAFSRKGVCLGDTCVRLRRNWDVTRCASSYHPAAILKSISSKAQGAPTNIKPFMIDLLQRVDGSDLATKIFKKCSKRLQGDRDVMLAAARKGVSASILKLIGNNDDSLWRAVIQHNPSSYPFFVHANKCEHDLSLATLVLQNATVSDYDVVTYIKRSQPRAFLDEAARLHIATTFPDPRSVFASVVDDFHLFSDKQLVLALARAEPEVTWDKLMSIDSDLCNDEDVLRAMVSLDPLLLEDIPLEIQVEHPSVVVAAFEQCGEDDIEMLMEDAVAEPLWSHREILLAFIKGGGSPELLHEFDIIDSPHLLDDEELFLAIVEHDDDSAYLIPDRFTKNKNFMMKAVAKSADFYFRCSLKLRRDTDLLLIALDRDIPHVMSALEIGENKNDEFLLVDLAAKVRERLQLHESMVTFYLGTRDLESSASSLECGHETKHAMFASIVGYAGVPDDRELQRLRRVSTLLCNRGF